jgi:hypothetical protein
VASFFAGSFTTNTSTGNQSVTGVGFVPVAVYFFTSGSTATGSSANSIMGIGAATSTSQRSALSGGSVDNIDPTNAESRFVVNAAFQIHFNGATLFEADFVSFDADGFTFNLTTAPAAGRLVSFVCFGGAGVSAYAGSFVGPTTTGTVSKTDPGFQPTAILTWGLNNNAIGILNDIHIRWGAASGAGEEYNLNIFDDDAVTTQDCRRRMYSAKCIGLGTTTVVDEADLTSFDANGFTLDYTTQDGTARYVGYLVLNGVQAQTIAFTQHTSNANLAVTGAGFTPKCVIVQHAGSTSNDASVDDIVAGLGAATSTSARSAWCQAIDDGATTSLTDRRYVTDKVVTILTPPTPTLVGEADLASFDADGATFTWSSVDGTARNMFGLFLGDAPGGGITYPPITSDLYSPIFGGRVAA